MIKISIIVPIYNIEKYLKRCLDSLVSQTYKEIEIILVNDGSTDSSPDIIKQFETDQRIVVINKENGGASSARNAGMRASSGDYVMFVDGDDYIDADAVEKLVKHIDGNTELILFPYIREFKNKSVKSYLFNEDYIEFDSELVREKIFARLIGPDPISKNNYPGNIDRLNTVWGKVYCKKLIFDIIFVDEKTIGNEDGLFNIQTLYKCKSAKYVTDIFYHYEKTNQNSLLHKYDKDFLNKRLKLYELINNFLKTNSEEKYVPNLKNRIAFEIFGILSNIWNTNETSSSKRVSTKNVLNDSLYMSVYKSFSLRCVDVLWRPFYFMCIHKLHFGVETAFRLYSVFLRLRG